MKKYLITLIAGMLISVNSPSQNILKEIGRAINSSNQQRSSQRTNYQRTFQDNQRNERRERIYQQRREAIQRNNAQMQNSLERVESSNNGNQSSIVNQQQNSTSASSDVGKSVTLVAYGTAVNESEAVKTALRSAIEQAFGTFVSANTQIVNDELIKDEIVSVTSGNIEKYSLISSERESNGKTSVVVKATISIGKLLEFAQSKGATTELAGAAFAMNMKIWKAEKANEYQALQILNEQMCQIVKKGIYDYKITTEEPSILSNNWYKIPIRIDITPNSNASVLVDCIINTLKGITIPLSDLDSYKKAGLSYYSINELGESERHYSSKAEKFYLRNNILDNSDNVITTMKLLKILKTISACSFKIEDNLGNKINPVTDSSIGFDIASIIGHSFFLNDTHLRKPEAYSGMGVFRNNYHTVAKEQWYYPLDLQRASFHLLLCLRYSEEELSKLSRINVSFNESFMDKFFEKGTKENSIISEYINNYEP